jgi:hypothetical protein
MSPGNLDQAREIVRGLAPTSLATDFLPGFADALAGLDRGVGSNKEVYLFSDMQKLGWERQGGALRAKAEELAGRATLFLVRCANPDRAVKNVTVLDVVPQGGIPHTGARTPFTVLIRNTGREDVTDLTVTLEVDGRPLEKDARPVDRIQAGETKAVTLTGKIDEAGFKVLTAKVQPDDLDGDNRFDKVVLVRDQVRVLIVDGSPNSRDPSKSASYFLGHAVRPIPDQFARTFHIRPVQVPAGEAVPALLAGVDICFLANVSLSAADRTRAEPVPAEFLERLAAFVREGKGLVISGGSNVVPERYNKLLGPPPDGVGLLPFELAGVVQAGKDRPFHPAPESADVQSFLGRFREAPLDEVGKNVDIDQFLSVKEQGDAGGRVIWRLNNDLPLVTAKSVGDGEVIFFASTLDPEWCTLALRGNYLLPFVHLTMTHLVQRPAKGLNRVAGETLRWHPTDLRYTGGYTLVHPDGPRTRLGKPQGGGADDRLTVTATDTPRAGVYQIVPDGEAPGKDKGPRFAVAADVRETESLDALSDAEIDDALGFRPVHLKAGEDAGAFAGNERDRREWTVWALVLLFLLTLGETAWAWVCGRAW